MQNSQNNIKNALHGALSFISFIVKGFVIMFLIGAGLLCYEMTFPEHYSEVSQKEINETITKIPINESEINKVLYSKGIQVAVMQSVWESTGIIVELKPEATKNLVNKIIEETIRSGSDYHLKEGNNYSFCFRKEYIDKTNNEKLIKAMVDFEIENKTSFRRFTKYDTFNGVNYIIDKSNNLLFICKCERE